MGTSWFSTFLFAGLLTCLLCTWHRVRHSWGMPPPTHPPASAWDCTVQNIPLCPAISWSFLGQLQAHCHSLLLITYPKSCCFPAMLPVLAENTSQGLGPQPLAGLMAELVSSATVGRLASAPSQSSPPFSRSVLSPLNEMLNNYDHLLACKTLTLFRPKSVPSWLPRLWSSRARAVILPCTRLASASLSWPTAAPLVYPPCSSADELASYSSGCFCFFFFFPPEKCLHQLPRPHYPGTVEGGSSCVHWTHSCHCLLDPSPSTVCQVALILSGFLKSTSLPPTSFVTDFSKGQLHCCLQLLSRPRDCCTPSSRSCVGSPCAFGCLPHPSFLLMGFGSS
nr:uncharacterized protein LOC127492761 [Oryctolagus cuniculus]